MRVLIVPSWYTPGPNKQLGSFFREQAMALLQDGVDVILADATLQGRDNIISKNNFHLRNFSDEGLDTYAYTVPALKLSKVPKLFVKVFYHNLEKIFRRIQRDSKKIDIIHAHSFYPAGYAAVILGDKYGIPVVITEHSSSIVAKKLNGFQEDLLKVCVEKSAKFICVGNALRQSVINYTHTVKKIYVIPNMVDNRFVPNNDATQREPFFYVSIGNLIHSKRFDLTIKSFAMCFKGQEQIKLKIIGDGELSSELRSLAEELDVAQQVLFMGRLSRDEVVRELQASHAFVLPSDFETFGVVYIEAMACGLPVIGTKNGGADDIITPADGYLVNVDSLDELKEAMEECYRSYQTFDRTKIADCCKKRFGEERVSSEIKALYDKLML